MTLTYKEVAEILKIIDASDCEEVVLELEGVKLQVRRGGDTSISSRPGSPELSTSSAKRPQPSPGNAKDVQESAATSTSKTSRGDGIEVRAPMVGTFYRCSAPDKPPFVEPGDSVQAGTPLCLIEVMKLYTTIEADCAGTIVSIGPADGDLVEFDQLLFVIKPD